MNKKYTPEELANNQEKKLRAHSGTLTTYAAMYGNSFAQKVDLLAQLIQGTHYPSLGLYKERLLKRVISNFIPKRYDIATGFVVFPKTYSLQISAVHGRNLESLHDVSSQLDLVVFDSYTYPSVFKDEDFVVLRPESVCAIIEVKGALNHEETDKTIDKFVDYSRKWEAYKILYESNFPYKSKLIFPRQILMAWDVAYDSNDRPKTDGKRLRERIVKRYKELVLPDELLHLPLLEAAYIYDECKVEQVYYPFENTKNYALGYFTSTGCLSRYIEEESVLQSVGDGTLASLLDLVQRSLENSYNPCFAEVDQAEGLNQLDYEFSGETCLIEDAMPRLKG